ncbi:MAG: alpha/beta fold hydrolase, partial [Phycisphaerales bacterium]|nr:alpha/beta fold hydrolase [Phycisphaerales bacterium]
GKPGQALTEEGIIGAIIELLQRNWALISIVVTLVILVVVPILILRKYVHLIANIFQNTHVPLSFTARDYPRVGGEVVDFRAFDGHLLKGVFLKPNPDASQKGVVIFAHELDSDKYSANRYCEALINDGFEVFAFDFRGQGESIPEDGYKVRLWPSDREQADMLGAIAFVEDWLEQQGRPREVGLVGVSRGAGAAVISAVHVPSVKAIMIDGGFSTDAYLEYLMQRWVGIFAKVRLVYENHHPAFWRFLRWLTIREVSRRQNCRFPSVRKSLHRLGAMPLMVIHGEKDGHIPVTQAQMIFELARGPKYLWICPRAKHNQAVVTQPELYGSYSVRFFRQHLCGMVQDEPLRGDGLLSQIAQPLDEIPRISYTKYTKPDRMRTRARK